MSCGSTVASWASSSCSLIPVGASSLIVFWPARRRAGRAGSVDSPGPTQELTCGAGAAGGELADEVGETAETLPAGGRQ